MEIDRLLNCLMISEGRRDDVQASSGVNTRGDRAARRARGLESQQRIIDRRRELISYMLRSDYFSEADRRDAAADMAAAIVNKVVYGITSEKLMGN